MWKIWKEELYKLASRRILWIGLFLLAGFMGMRLLSERRNYTITIGQQTYTGQEAIEKDRQITAEYAGILTFETVEKIYDRFGFYYYNARTDSYIGNFANQFITYKMTNFNQTEEISPEEIHFLAEEEWEQNAAPLLNGTVWFDYTYGWNDFREIFCILTVAALLLLFIIGISPVFSEEYTYQTADILLTCRRGRKSGIWLKMSAAVFLAAAVYAVSALYLFVLYAAVYGTQGLDASCVLINVPVSGYHPEKISGFFLYSFLLGLSAVLLVTFMTLAVSACCKNAFLTVILSLALFFLPYVWMNVLSPMLAPLLGWNIIKAVSHFIVSMPFYLSVSWGFAFSEREILLHMLTAAATGCFCAVSGYYKYRNYQG